MLRRRMWADAHRNYQRLLTEAAAAFAEHGADFSLEAIARRAGVANGTLYGHFPTRRALLEALVGDRMQAIEDESSELHAACQAVLAAGEQLLARTRTTGEVRPDVTAPDLYALVNAAAWAGEQSSPPQGERLVTFGPDGFRTSATDHA